MYCFIYCMLSCVFVNIVPMSTEELVGVDQDRLFEEEQSEF
jgi:hypothetical protein